jgi:hypothetical protein
MKTLNFIAAMALLSLLTACNTGNAEFEASEPIPLETSNAALTASENVKQNLIDLGDMLAFMEKSTLMLDAFGMFEDSQTVCVPLPAGEEGEPECYEESSEVVVDTDMTEIANEIANWLNENVFVDGQLESEGDSLVYLLDPGTFCAFDGEDDDGDNQECIDILTKIPIRVRLTSYNEGDLDIDILVGEAQLDPIDLRLYDNLLGVAVDLAATKDVAQLYFDTFGEEGEELEFPSTFSGVLSLSLERTGEGQYELAYEVEKAVQVGLTIEDDEFNISLDKSTVTMTADAATKSISMAAKMGALDVTFPYQAFINAMWDEGEEEYGEGSTESPDDKPEEPQPYDDIMEEEVPSVSGTSALHIAGFTGSATFSAESDSLAITGLGLGNGPTTFKRNDDTLLSIDLNSGGTFDLDVSVDNEDVIVTVAPKFDLSAMFALATIADDLDELPGFLADDTLTATLDGADAPSLRMQDELDALQVVEGQLTLASLAYPDDTVVVAQGQCVHGEASEESSSPDVPDEEEDPLPEENEDGHELLSGLVVGDCQ